MNILAGAVLFAASFPFIYHLIAIFSTLRYFRKKRLAHPSGFTPPVSNLKPIRGVDPDAYENFASLCRQEYPDYELLFAVSHKDDPVVSILERLIADFPERQIRIIFESSGSGTNDKVCKLARLVAEARHDVFVINDSDVWVAPDYLRTVVAPLENPAIGAVTCFYTSRDESTFAEILQTVGMMSDFYPGIIVARQLDGVKFALGPTIATTRARLEAFGGYESLKNRPADDLLVGRLIAEQGCEVELLPYSVLTVSDYASFSELLHKRLRWLVVMRHLRPGGHFGLLFTFSLAWSLLAIAMEPTAAVAVAYLGTYLCLRTVMTLLVAGWGLKQPRFWRKLFLIPLWDAVAFGLWLTSFTRTSIRWRNADYSIQHGQLVPIASKPAR